MTILSLFSAPPNCSHFGWRLPAPCHLRLRIYGWRLCPARAPSPPAPPPPPPPSPQVVTGRWLVDGNPQIILFDVGSASWKMNEMKDELWNLAGIGIPNPDVECNDAVVFGYMVAEFLQQVRPSVEKSPGGGSALHIICSWCGAGVGT